MKTILHLCAITATIAITTPHLAQAAWFNHEDDDMLANITKAKLNITEAIQKATNVQEGTVVSAELDDCDDKGVFYEIEIIQNNKEYDLYVDAITGDVTFEKELFE